MSIVPLYIEDAFSGCMVPNRPAPEQFMVVSNQGAEAIFNTRNEAIQFIAFADYNETHEVVFCPAIKIQGYKNA